MNQRDNYRAEQQHPVAQFMAGCVFGVLLGGLAVLGLGVTPLILAIAAIVSGLLFGLSCALWGERAWQWLSRQRRWMDWLP